jgi:hypothetical protein
MNIKLILFFSLFVLILSGCTPEGNVYIINNSSNEVKFKLLFAEGSEEGLIPRERILSAGYQKSRFVHCKFELKGGKMLNFYENEIAIRRKNQSSQLFFLVTDDQIQIIDKSEITSFYKRFKAMKKGSNKILL